MRERSFSDCFLVWCMRGATPAPSSVPLRAGNSVSVCPPACPPIGPLPVAVRTLVCRLSVLPLCPCVQPSVCPSVRPLSCLLIDPRFVRLTNGFGWPANEALLLLLSCLCLFLPLATLDQRPPMQVGARARMQTCKGKATLDVKRLSRDAAMRNDNRRRRAWDHGA